MTKTSESGQTKIRFTQFYSGLDFGESATYKPGDEIAVNVELAKTMQNDWGPDCPFEVVKENKAVGEAPKKK